MVTTNNTGSNIPSSAERPTPLSQPGVLSSRGMDTAVVGAPVRRISWGAVAAGAVTALAIQILLGMLGTGIGASTIDTVNGGESPTAAAFGTGAAIWWFASISISLIAGGWIAGRLSGAVRTSEGGMHGMLTWAVLVLAMAYILTSAAGSLVRGAAGVLGTAATVTATGAAAAAPKIADAAGEQLDKAGISFDTIKQEALAVLKQTGKAELQPGNLTQQANSATADVSQTASNAGEQDFSALLQRLLSKGRNAASEVDREAVVNVVMARSGLSREEATKRVAGWQSTADQARAKAAEATEQAKVKAREAADASAKAISGAMLMGFLAFAIGGLMAWWGGTLGQRRDVLVR